MILASRIAITDKTPTFAKRLKTKDMNEYTFEMVPGLVGRIAELLASIDQKLDKVIISSMPVDNTPELMDIKQLSGYLPWTVRYGYISLDLWVCPSTVFAS